MIFVESPPDEQGLIRMLNHGGDGGLRYFRCRSKAHRQTLRTRIEKQGALCGTKVSCQGVTVNGARGNTLGPVLKVQFGPPLLVRPKFGADQVVPD